MAKDENEIKNLTEATVRAIVINAKSELEFEQVRDNLPFESLELINILVAIDKIVNGELSKISEAHQVTDYTSLIKLLKEHQFLS